MAAQAPETASWRVFFENGDVVEVLAPDEAEAVAKAYADGTHFGIGHWGAENLDS